MSELNTQVGCHHNHIVRMVSLVAWYQPGTNQSDHAINVIMEAAYPSIELRHL